MPARPASTPGRGSPADCDIAPRPSFFPAARDPLEDSQLSRVVSRRRSVPSARGRPFKTPPTLPPKTTSFVTAAPARLKITSRRSTGSPSLWRYERGGAAGCGGMGGMEGRWSAVKFHRKPTGRDSSWLLVRSWHFKRNHVRRAPGWTGPDWAGGKPSPPLARWDGTVWYRECL